MSEMITDAEVNNYRNNWHMYKEAHNGFEHYLVFLIKDLIDQNNKLREKKGTTSDEELADLKDANKSLVKALTSEGAELRAVRAQLKVAQSVHTNQASIIRLQTVRKEMRV